MIRLARAIAAVQPRSAVLFGASMALALYAFLGEGSASLRPGPVLAMWGGSVAVFLTAARTLGTGKPVARRAFGRLELGVLLALTVAALLARSIALGRIPGNFSADEGEMGSFARSILEGHWHDPFTTGWLSHPTLWFFTQALSLKVFGNDVFGLRFLSALLGAATVLALYLFARRWYGTTVAIAAAALLAVNDFAVHFSRLGLNNATDPLFALAGFGAVLAGYERRSPIALALGGVVLGVGQNFYFGTRLAPVVLLALLAHQLVLGRERLRRAARYLPLTVLGFLIGYGPGMRVPLYHWNDYTSRLRSEGIFQSGWFDVRVDQGASPIHVLWQQFIDSAGAFTAIADRSPFYNPATPLIDPVSSFLFLAGLALVLFRGRRPVSGLVLAWLGGTVVFGGVLLVNTPEVQRFVTVAPVICLLIALALVRGSRALMLLPGSRRFLPGLAVATAVVALGGWNLNFYFWDYTPRRTYGFRPTEAATAIAGYLRSRHGSYVYFLGPPYVFLENGTIRFLASDPPGIDVEPALGAAPLPSLPAGLRPLFVLHPARAGELAAIRRLYPHGTLSRVSSPVDGAPMFIGYEPAR